MDKQRCLKKRSSYGRVENEEKKIEEGIRQTREKEESEKNDELVKFRYEDACVKTTLKKVL